MTIRDLPKPEALRRLHVQLGHLHVDAIKRMIKEEMVEGLPKDIDFSDVPLNCPQCLAGKFSKIPYPDHKREPSH